MAKPYLSVIIPVFNGAEDLPLTLIDADKHLSEQDYSYEILVVNDGSSDATAKIVNKFTPLIRNLKLIDNPDNQGMGPIIRVAMAAARGNIRAVMSARNITPVTEFNKMMPALREGHDLIIGSAGFDFWCITEEAAQNLFALTKTTRWAFYYEVLALAKVLGYKIKFTAPLYRWNVSFYARPLEWFFWLWEFIKIRWRIRKFVKSLSH